MHQNSIDSKHLVYVMEWFSPLVSSYKVLVHLTELHFKAADFISHCRGGFKHTLCTFTAFQRL